jgi:Ca2+-binding RTX toxin-like protein
LFLIRSKEAREVKVFAICSADSDATVVATTSSVEAGKVGDAVATCPAGKRVLGGGTAILSGGPNDFIQQSNPVDSSGTTAETTSGDVARSWFASIYHSSAGNPSATFQVVAICASDEPQPAPPKTSTTTTTTAPKPPAKAVCAGQQATIVGTSGPDRLKGTPGVDVIAGLGGNDIVNGVGGNDTICGGSGNDTILGAGGNDTLRGDGGNDRLRGGIGNDILTGAFGNDTLFGEAGDDILSGGPGDDYLAGGKGTDTLSGGPGRNTVKP